MSDRGIKKWAAYRALIEQDSAVVQMHEDRKKIERPVLSEDKIEEINEYLTNYEGQLCEISIYKNREIKTINCHIYKIDPVDKYLLVDDRKRIYLKDLIGIKNID